MSEAQPLLVYPDLTPPFEFKADASKNVISAILVQRDDTDREHPVGYASRSLKATYTTNE